MIERRAEPLPRRTIPGLAKSASVMALGFDSFRTYEEAAAMLDAFVAAGGNVIDTGWVYGHGRPEGYFGQWRAARGLRDELVLISKGAHSPLCFPDQIGKQLGESLDRFQTDYVDVYFMHRDNLDIPVGEFVDAMDAEAKAGRIRGIFGGSNWTRERIDEAVAYAKRAGKIAPAALSNNFTLAEMLEPLWPGVLSAYGPEWREWLVARGIPNFSWSSQARGFFTDRAGPDKRSDPEMVRGWYSDANFARRERAIALGKELGATPTQVVLAYIMAQPFVSIPLVGPRAPSELEESLGAARLSLTPEQVRALEG
jgi:aryl-alcohol dehydrogenase-like predicted oxidoreductase